MKKFYLKKQSAINYMNMDDTDDTDYTIMTLNDIKNSENPVITFYSSFNNVFTYNNTINNVKTNYENNISSQKFIDKINFFSA